MHVIDVGIALLSDNIWWTDSCGCGKLRMGAYVRLCLTVAILRDTFRFEAQPVSCSEATCRPCCCNSPLTATKRGRTDCEGLAYSNVVLDKCLRRPGSQTLDWALEVYKPDSIPD